MKANYGFLNSSKNEWNSLSCASCVFWKNWGDHKLLSIFTDLYLKYLFAVFKLFKVLACFYFMAQMQRTSDCKKCGIKRKKSIWLVEKYLKKNHLCLLNNVCFRYLSRFFDRLAHETTHAYIGNKHVFTKSFRWQTG